MKLWLLIGLTTNIISVWTALYWRERYWDAERMRMYLRKLDARNVK